MLGKQNLKIVHKNQEFGLFALFWFELLFSLEDATTATVAPAAVTAPLTVAVVAKIPNAPND